MQSKESKPLRLRLVRCVEIENKQGTGSHEGTRFDHGSTGDMTSFISHSVTLAVSDQGSESLA